MKMSYSKVSNFISVCKLMVICGVLSSANEVYCDEHPNGASPESAGIKFSYSGQNDSIQDNQTNENWSIHGQSTYLFQKNDRFFSQYHSQNSLLNQNEGGGDKSYTFSATSFIGRRLWRGAEFYFNPEIFQGIPFNGQLVGLGGFQNGEY